MKRIYISLLLSVVVFATGCPKPQYRPALSFDQGMVEKFNAALKRQYREYECYRFGPTHIDFQGNVCTGYTENIDKAQAVRNELIENALPYIDQSYMNFITNLQAGRDSQNYLLDLVDLSGAAAVGITKGERALQIIGVGLTAFRGGRKSYDANFYKDTSTPILISKMDGNRAAVRATILEREKQSPDDYELGAAVGDLVEYYNVGTLVRAFTQLQEDTAVKTQAAQAHLANLKAAGVKGAPTADMVAASKKNAEDLRALRAAYTAAVRRIGTADTKITNAVLAIGAAGNAITTADQDIGVANEHLAAAKTAVARTQAQAELTKAEGDKAKAEGDKAKGEANKTTGETEKTAAVTARDQAFNKLRGIYDAIAADPKLGPILNTVPDNPDFDAARKTELQGEIQRNKGRTPPATEAERKTAVDEYFDVLNEFSYIVVQRFTNESELNKRLQEIIKANQ